MDCTQIDGYLDDMMDGTLDAEALDALEAHCATCAECAAKLQVNRELMRLFSEMTPEMDVPLTAQAGWRDAVKRESRSVGRRRLLRYAGGIAAVLVVALVATFALTPPKNDAANGPVMAESVEESVSFDAGLIQTDGETDQTISFNREPAMASRDEAFEAAADSAPMQEIDLVVDDVERVCAYADDLALEYESAIVIQRFEEDGMPCANLYVNMPEANAAEFIEAMLLFDQSGTQTQNVAIDGDASILLVLKSK